MNSKIKQYYERLQYFGFIAGLYLKNTPYARLILFVSFVAGIGQILASTLIVPIVSTFLKGADFGKSAQINKYVQSITEWLGLEMSILNLLVLMISIEFISILLTYLQERLGYYSKAKFTIRLKKRLFQNILKARWECLLSLSSGKVASLFSLETERAKASAFLLLNAIVSFIYCVIFIFAFSIFFWKMLVLIIPVVLLSFYITNNIQLKTNKLGKVLTVENNSFLSLVVELLQGIKLIKVSGLEKYSQRIFDETSQKNQAIAKEIEDYQAKMAFLMTFYASVTRAVLIFFSLIVLSIPIPMLALLLYLYQRVMPRITNFQSLMLSFLASCSSLENIEKFQQELKIEEIPTNNKLIFKELKQGIYLKNITFRYSKKMVLDNINLFLESKKTIGITGPSGAGKSTLVDLLVGLHRPQKGMTLIDSKNIFEYQIKTWREKIGYVTQDDIMFNDTVWNNLVFGLENMDKEWVEFCANLANIHQTIIETPNGYDTIIGENGIKLSGGQKQRLSLARALIRRPELLILDEATSALDTESEKIIQNSIKKISHKMTILIIAHRLSTLADADIIYVIEKGKCIENGCYSKLVEAGGYFSKISAMQYTKSVKQVNIE